MTLPLSHEQLEKDRDEVDLTRATHAIPRNGRTIQKLLAISTPRARSWSVVRRAASAQPIEKIASAKPLPSSPPPAPCRQLFDGGARLALERSALRWAAGFCPRATWAGVAQQASELLLLSAPN